MMTILAQAAPGVPVDFNAWLGQIAQYGLLGVMFLLVGYALFKRDKDLTAERASRLADALAMRGLIEADTAAKVAAIKLQEEHNRLLETIARNQETLTATAKNLVDDAIAADVANTQRVLEAVQKGVDTMRVDAESLIRRYTVERGKQP